MDNFEDINANNFKINSHFTSLNKKGKKGTTGEMKNLSSVRKRSGEHRVEMFSS